MDNEQNHLPFLYNLRGIAILSVYLLHSYVLSLGISDLEWSGYFRKFDFSFSYLLLFPFSYGSAGVAIFFVISGFCIHLSHARSEDSNWLSFFRKRFCRIYPPYLVALCIFFFLPPWGSFSFETSTRSLQFFSHLLLAHNLYAESYFSINPAFWSIAIEVQLYALYPILTWITGKYGWKSGILVVATVELAIRTSLSLYRVINWSPLPVFIFCSPFAFWLSWSIGAYLAESYLKNKRNVLTFLRLDFMIITALTAPLFKPTEAFAFLIYSLTTGVAINHFISNVSRISEHKFYSRFWLHLSKLGRVSYSFYLIHQPIILWIIPKFEKLIPNIYSQPLGKMALCVAIYMPIMILSSIMYKVIEKPATIWGQHEFWCRYIPLTK